MCGIAGWVASGPQPHDEATLAAMLDSLAHRGPDGQGVVSMPSGKNGGQVFLGHRRLAIIDVAGGAQPMCDAASGLALVFNGEIYNFRELRARLAALGHAFVRDSDTEVLLRAYQQWGDGVVDHLRGMFAFAVWDAHRHRLFLARDRFGEKPLYLLETPHALYFASEIKALLRAPGVKAEVDPAAVHDYLAYRYVPAPATLFRNIRKLMPGTFAVWQGGTLREQRYWTAPDQRAGAASRPAGDIAGQFLGRLDEAVALQMVSDVPFGAFLSGGLDSSTIVGLMKRHAPQVKTFSVGFAEGAYSELGYASMVASHFGTEHHELIVTEQDIIDRLPRLVAFRDAPVSEPSDIAIHMLACEASRTVKMVLTGEGSDEILGGYPKHVIERYARGYQYVPSSVRHGLIAPLARALPYRFRRIKTAVATLDIDNWRERYVRWFGALSNQERARLAPAGHAAQPASFGQAAQAPGEGPPFDADPAGGALRRQLYFDQTSWLPDNLLERADRMTMAASIEARVPFLDHRLADFVSALPDDCRVRGLRTKWILREAARQLLPAKILERKKVGFRVPVNLWFRGRLREMLADHLQGPGSRTRHYYDARVLDDVMSSHARGRQNHEKLLWTLLNLEIWHRHYVTA